MSYATSNKGSRANLQLWVTAYQTDWLSSLSDCVLENPIQSLFPNPAKINPPLVRFDR